jgi:cation-transporting ATPase 13A3/4/5
LIFISLINFLLKIYRGVGVVKIVVESLDLITIAVPPALPGKIY